MSPITVIATLKSVNGKPNDPGAAPVADLALRTEATPELLTLFSGIGQEFDVTFTRRGGEQMSFDFDASASEDDDEDTTTMDLTPKELEEVTSLDVGVDMNGTVHEPAPATGGRRRR